MVNILMGTVLGFLSGLGVGGGSLLLLWLTLVVGTDSFTARGINLLFFLPAAAVSCWFRWNQGSLEPKKILPAVLAGCLGALVGSWICDNADTQILQKGFGLLLVATGFRELFWKPRKTEIS